MNHAVVLREPYLKKPRSLPMPMRKEVIDEWVRKGKRGWDGRLEYAEITSPVACLALGDLEEIAQRFFPQASSHDIYLDLIVGEHNHVFRFTYSPVSAEEARNLGSYRKSPFDS